MNEDLVQELCQTLGILRTLIECWKHIKHFNIFLVKEIVEKHLHKGLTDLVHVDSFLSYIEGEAVLQQMIVTSVDQSVLGGGSTRIELQIKVPL